MLSTLRESVTHWGVSKLGHFDSSFWLYDAIFNAGVWDDMEQYGCYAKLEFCSNGVIPQIQIWVACFCPWTRLHVSPVLVWKSVSEALVISLRYLEQLNERFK